ncbi:MAG: carbamoyltransferase HypF [Ginsengibacter sp.]
MTFHLHIKGRVQGVGFRPHVYKCAFKKNIFGYVSNDADGVHVTFNNLSKKNADAFVEEIIQLAPTKAIIQSWCLREIPEETFTKFSIRVCENIAQPDLLISPDFAMCEQCRKEFHDPTNRRYNYPFITCTLCGPRYSIMKRLPYERYLTAMDNFIQCPECQKEYNDVNDRRYFSQTNSCASCGIQLSWHSKQSNKILNNQKQILAVLLTALRENKIIAVKGIGGFLLLCDATNKKAIQTLRERKHRPKKPFAVLFPGVQSDGYRMVQKYTHANELAIHALLDEASPILLLQAKEECFKQLDMVGIAPGLSSIGVMLPYAPLLEWIISEWKKPLIATSGNVSGSCIVFKSEKKEELFQYADYILDHNREIVIPQDDSVIRFAEKSHQQIIIRRSRGLAPAIISFLEKKTTETIFAAGAMLKSAFAIQQNNQIYLSQFLGNLESYDTQQNYRHTFDHFQQLLKAQPQIVLADIHPDYPSTQLAAEYSKQLKVPLRKIQHHEAHFAAILGEHNLFKSEEKILGVIWDGTGLGSDGNIWGGEFFIYEKGKMERVYYLEPFVNIAGDKMAKEPRLAAFTISNKIEEVSSVLESRFTKQEWLYYHKEIKQQKMQNTSAGRYFDGIASLLDFININTYEGEAALVLEQHAYNYLNENNFEISEHYFHEEIEEPVIPMKNVIRNIIKDINSGKSKAEIAALFHASLTAIIWKVALKLGVKKIAFSGGVFQNVVLIDLLFTQLKKIVYLEVEKKSELYFHRQMPPNDECIAFGQIMHHINIIFHN